jgi:molybdopterin molybdotransferase
MTTSHAPSPASPRSHRHPLPPTATDADWAEARSIAHSAGAAAAARSETLPLADAAGRTLAAPVLARTALPGFSSSAMDGWAVAGDGPWLLGPAINAGTVGVAARLRAGTGRPIATGAMLPPGTRAVLRSEHGIVRASALGPVLHRAPGVPRDEPLDGAHLRLAGEEAPEGAVLVAAGTRVTPPRLALAAAGGADTVTVRARPVARVLVLGDEVIASGVAPAGLVRDAFGPQLPALLRSLGLDGAHARHVGDDRAATTAALTAGGADLVVVTGGSSRGATDHARAALLAAGAHLLVDGVRVRPGHPVILALMGDGTLVLCLPGNPAAGMLALLGLGLPLVDGLLGRPPAALDTGVAAVAIDGAGSGVRLVACAVADGLATPCAAQSPAMLSGLAAADTVLVVPPGGAPAGATVAAIRPPW